MTAPTLTLVPDSLSTVFHNLYIFYHCWMITLKKTAVVIFVSWQFFRNLIKNQEFKLLYKAVSCVTVFRLNNTIGSEMSLHIQAVDDS